MESGSAFNTNSILLSGTLHSGREDTINYNTHIPCFEEKQDSKTVNNEKHSHDKETPCKIYLDTDKQRSLTTETSVAVESKERRTPGVYHRGSTINHYRNITNNEINSLGFNSGDQHQLQNQMSATDLYDNMYLDAITSRGDLITSRDDAITSRAEDITSMSYPRRANTTFHKEPQMSSFLFEPRGEIMHHTHRDHVGLTLPRRRIPLESLTDEKSSCENKSYTPSGEKVETFAEFTQSMTASFVRFLFEKGSPMIRRFIWFVMWIICSGYALSNIYNAFNQYLMFDTSTQLSFKYGEDGNLSLPAITICNMNKYRKSWLDLPENDMLKKYEEKRVWEPKGKNITITYQDNEKAKNITVDMLELSGKHSIDNMFLSVEFDERNLFFESVDWRTHFTERFTELGNCFTFNSDGNKKVKRTGTNFGATFTININQSEYADTQESAGIKVMLHHFQEPPLIKEFGLAIAPGSEAFISTRALEMYNLGIPYKNSNCTSEPDPYSQMGCTLKCHAEILSKACNCKQSHMPLDKIRVCSLYENHACAEETIRKIHKGEYNDRMRECWCNEACNSTSYTYSLSKANYPSVAAANAILNTKNPGGELLFPFDDIDGLKENFILLHVYFETLAVEKIQKVPSYSVTNLLGDSGGNLGLFIGASVATLAEVLDYIARLLYVLFRS